MAVVAFLAVVWAVMFCSTPSKGPVGNNAPGEPLVVTTETTAVEYIEHYQDLFKNQEVTDDLFQMMSRYLKGRLNKNEITFVYQLYQKLTSTGSVHVKVISALSSSGYEPTAIEVHLKTEVYFRNEDKLNHKVFSFNIFLREGKDVDEEVKRADRTYKEEALSYKGSNVQRCKNKAGERTHSISIVLGPSGSGKTLLSLKYLPNVGHTTEQYFTIYCKASTIVNRLLKSATERQYNEVAEAFKSQLAVVLKKDHIEKLQMTLTVVIDEAGSFLESRYNALLQDVDQLQEFRKSLQGTVAKSVRLVIAGTGIDAATSKLESSGEVTKYRMKPWKMKQVEVVIENMIPNSLDGARMKSIITEHNILQNLLTNARAASIMVDVLHRRLQWSSRFHDIGGIVSEVSTEYINSNGIKQLKDESRLLLAQAVFRAVWESSESKGKAYFPELDSNVQSSPLVGNRQRFKSCFLGLLDINVEQTNGNEPHFVKEHEPYSVSVTGAIYIVLLALMDIEGVLGMNWSDFETICALNELQRAVVKLPHENIVKEAPQLFFMEKAFPPTTFKLNMRFPIKLGNGVYRNGNRAPFADAISMHRLCQCKFVGDANSDVTLGLNEFVKLGIVKEILQSGGKQGGSKMEMIRMKQCAFLSALVPSWDAESEVDQQLEAPIRRQSLLDANHTSSETRQAYPSCHLIGDTNYGPQPKYADCTYKNGTLTVKNTQTGKETHYKHDDRLKEEIKAVFYTNAKSFKIGKEIVAPTDVDVEGCLKDEALERVLLKGLGVTLRENTSLCFIFMRNQKLEY